MAAGRAEEVTVPITVNWTVSMLHTTNFFVEELATPSSLGCFPLSLDPALKKCGSDSSCVGFSFCADSWWGSASADMACFEGSLSHGLSVGGGCDGYYKDPSILDFVDTASAWRPTAAVFASFFALALFLPVLGLMSGPWPRLAWRAGRLDVNYVFEAAAFVLLASFCFGLFLRAGLLQTACPERMQGKQSSSVTVAAGSALVGGGA